MTAVSLADPIATEFAEWMLFADASNRVQCFTVGLLDSAGNELSGSGYGRLASYNTTVTILPGRIDWDDVPLVFTVPAATVRYAALYTDSLEPAWSVRIQLDSDAVTGAGDTVTVTSLSLTVASYAGGVYGDPAMLKMIGAEALDTNLTRQWRTTGAGTDAVSPEIVPGDEVSAGVYSDSSVPVRLTELDIGDTFQGTRCKGDTNETQVAGLFTGGDVTLVGGTGPQTCLDITVLDYEVSG